MRPARNISELAQKTSHSLERAGTRLRKEKLSSVIDSDDYGSSGSNMKPTAAMSDMPIWSEFQAPTSRTVAPPSRLGTSPKTRTLTDYLQLKSTISSLNRVRFECTFKMHW